MNGAKKLDRPATMADTSVPSRRLGEARSSTASSTPSRVLALLTPRASKAECTAICTALSIEVAAALAAGGSSSRPGIEVARSPEFSPDVAGWRSRPNAQAAAEGRARSRSSPISDLRSALAEHSLGAHDNLVNSRNASTPSSASRTSGTSTLKRLLAVTKLVEGKWLELGVYGETEKVRANRSDALKESISRAGSKESKRRVTALVHAPLPDFAAAAGPRRRGASCLP